MLACRYKKPADYIISRLFLCFFLVFGSSGYAQSSDPFLTRNQSPFSLIYGIPYASPARLLEQNTSRWISSLNISNELIVQTDSTNQLDVDLETWQFNLFYDYAFNKNWMFRLQLPLIAHTGGMFDSAIDSFHQALNFPEGLRPIYPHNQIDISYAQSNTDQININNSEKDLGDISLQLAWQSKKLNNMAISYWSSLKLPTGNHKKLTGSGSTDIATWSSIDYQLNNTRWLYGQAGLLFTYNNKVLDEIHNNWAAFANLGIKFQPWKPIELKAQLDLHSALFDSDILFLGEAAQITFGGSFLLNSKNKINFSVGEDLKRKASPDVSFNISWWINI